MRNKYVLSLINLLAYENTVTEKTIYQEVNVDNPSTGKVDKIGFPTWVREEKSYKAIEIEGVGGLEEERNVYVNDKLIVSQYRVGVIAGKDSKGINLSKNIKLSGGIEVKFNTPWIDNPIPKQEDKKPPVINAGY